MNPSLNPPNPSLSAPSRHANHILEVVRRGIAADTPERITGSWSRCVRQYGLDPLRPHIPPILDKHAVEERRARVSDIVECAGAEMCSLYEQLGDSDAAVILTDAEGVILNIVCSRELGQELSSLGLRIGAVWSEAEAGTNGMGTCIAARAPVAVRQSEHFFASYSPLTCSAVPIYDPAGSIAAVLDITTRSQLPQQYALALAGMTAQRVENRIIDLRFGDAYPIRFHSQPELVHTLQEGKLVVGHDGMVRAANRSALAQLGFRSMRDATSRKVEEIFGTDLYEMLERSVNNSFYPVATYRATATKPFFVVAQRPLIRPARARAGSESAQAAIAVSGGCSMSDPADDTPEFGDPRINGLLATARRLIERRLPILLFGETGVGKEVFARALHRVSPLAEGEFAVVDCAALPESVIDDLLMCAGGGAARLAGRGQRARAPQAQRGTLFLDEVGHLSLDVQARLLHALDQQPPVIAGSNASDGREFQIISASHCRLGELVQRGEFRDDLYYRLCGLEIEVPPLRERGNVRALIRRILADEVGPPYALAPAAEARLLAYSWPGNVRQLRHVLQAAAALTTGTTITVEALPSVVAAASHPETEVLTPSPVPLTAVNDPLPCAPEDDPRTAMMHLLEQHRWNVSRVAKSLGVSRNTLYRRLHRLDIALSHSQ